MKIILLDRNPNIVKAWQIAFSSFDPGKYNLKLDILQEDIRHYSKFLEKKNFNIICTAGNSYGVMGGGFDLVIAQLFPGIETQIRNIIAGYWFGELPVGQGVSAACDSSTINIIYYIPTMRAPIRLERGENVYLATKAALTNFYFEAEKYTALVSGAKFTEPVMIMPGFGGECGGLNPNLIARKMRLAFDNVFDFNPINMPNTTEQMRELHREIVL